MPNARFRDATTSADLYSSLAIMVKEGVNQHLTRTR